MSTQEMKEANKELAFLNAEYAQVLEALLPETEKSSRNKKSEQARGNKAGI